MKLSVIIITKNEAQNIGDCLASVAFADQWIIVDSSSVDGTVAIARAAGATVIETADWPGFGPQKNRALAAASGDWVLSLDADERVSDELQAEIMRVIGAAQHEVLQRVSATAKIQGWVLWALAASTASGSDTPHIGPRALTFWCSMRTLRPGPPV